MSKSNNTNTIYFGDNLEVIKTIDDKSIDLIYIDPPFNTGKKRKLTSIKTIQSNEGDRVGFKGNKYKTIKLGSKAYDDKFSHDFFIHEFLKPRLIEAYRVLSSRGSFYFHIDYREVHYCKILLDEIFGRECFLNELIWAYDFGGRSKKKWAAKHDNILLYVKDPSQYTFNLSEVDRIPYMAPGLVGKEKALRGKFPTDVWWHTIVPTNGKERTGYPTQKPRGIIDRIIKVSSNEGDLIMDFFAGSGTIGESCLVNNRRFILIDNNREAIEVMKKRFNKHEIKWLNIGG